LQFTASFCDEQTETKGENTIFLSFQKVKILTFYPFVKIAFSASLPISDQNSAFLIISTPFLIFSNFLKKKLHV